MHIKILKLSGLRGINRLVAPDADIWGADAGYDVMPEVNLARINIFCGRNGTGKSTILDAARALRRPEILSTLRSDGSHKGVLRVFEITFDDDRAVHIEFKRNSREIDVHVLNRENYEEKLIGRAFPLIGVNGCTLEQRRDVRKGIAAIRPMVFHWRGPDQATVGRRFVAALSLLDNELVGVAKSNGNPDISYAQGSIIEISYETDSDKHDLVPFDLIPSGWRAAAGLIAWISRLPKGSIATIEEPETHLHPRLQRRVAQELSRVSRERGIQLLVATHSHVFMNPSAWPNAREDKDLNHSPRVFQVDGRRFDVVPTPGSAASFDSVAALLDDLGVLASDLMQSNSVILVEGPSDRIYIKYWLMRWCAEFKLLQPVENIAYLFCYYGGSVLSHFNAYSKREATDTVNLLTLNRNAFVVLDRDADFEMTNEGTFVKTKTTPLAKYHVVDSLREREREWVWITSGNTIESYLPKKYVDEGYLEEKEGITKIGKRDTKVELARRYLRDTAKTPYDEIYSLDLRPPCDGLKKIYEFIQAANR